MKKPFCTALLMLGALWLWSCIVSVPVPAPGDAGQRSPGECLSEFGALLDSGVVPVGTDAAGYLAPDCQALLSRMAGGPCHDLVLLTCGASNECHGRAECIAAGLMTEFADGDSRCQKAHDEGQLSACVPPTSSCDDLVQYVCGGTRDGAKRCAGQPACNQALRLTDGDAGNACAAAFAESSLYPRCE